MRFARTDNIQLPSGPSTGSWRTVVEGAVMGGMDRLPGFLHLSAEAPPHPEVVFRHRASWGYLRPWAWVLRLVWALGCPRPAVWAHPRLPVLEALRHPPVATGQAHPHLPEEERQALQSQTPVLGVMPAPPHPPMEVAQALPHLPVGAKAEHQHLLVGAEEAPRRPLLAAVGSDSVAGYSGAGCPCR